MIINLSGGKTDPSQTKLDFSATSNNASQTELPIRIFYCSMRVKEKDEMSPILNSNDINSNNSNDNNTKNRTIMTAKIEFLRRVSEGISYLVHHHGYSRTKASNFILDEIRQSDPLPTENEIFSLVSKISLGVDEASEAIIVSNAIKKLETQSRLTPLQAIEYLSSHLTTKQLIEKVQRRADEHVARKHQNVNIASSLTPFKTNMMMRSTSKKTLSSTTTATATTTSTPSKCIKTKIKESANKRRSTSVSTKNSRKRQKGDDENEEKQQHKDAKDLKNTAVKKLVILPQNGNTNSHSSTNNNDVVPTLTSTAVTSTPKVSVPTRVGSKRDLESTVVNHHQQQVGQSVPKRRRLDSI